MTLDPGHHCLGNCGYCDVSIRGFMGEVSYKMQCSQCARQQSGCEVCYDVPRRLCTYCRKETCGFCGDVDLRDASGFPLGAKATERACTRCGTMRLQCIDCKPLDDPLTCRGCTMMKLGRSLSLNKDL
jgi:hypothetical protein